MKLLIASLLILASLSIFLSTQDNTTSLQQQTTDIQKEKYDLFLNWQQKYGKNTSNNTKFLQQNQEKEDQLYRFKVFTQNYDYITNFNQKPHEGNLKLGLNQFSDLTLEEFQQKFFEKNHYLDQQQNLQETENQEFLNDDTELLQDSDYPSVLNWTQKGAVTRVYNQGQCGSCWAFSVKQALEGQNYIQSGDLIEFSAQMLLNCSNQNYGCNGGFQDKALLFTQIYGIYDEDSLPYTSGNTGRSYSCNYDKSKVVFKNKDYGQVSPNSQPAMMKYIQRQPLSVTVCAGNSTFQHYESGIIVQCGCYTNDHAVLLTGYDTTGETPYWTVKNSWGTSWGYDGYVYLGMNGSGPGACGVNKSVYMPY